MEYEDIQREKQTGLLGTDFLGKDSGYGIYRGEIYKHILQNGKNNLFDDGNGIR